MPVPLAPLANIKADAPTAAPAHKQPSSQNVKSKKEPLPKPPPTPALKPPSKLSSHPPSQMKKISRRSSKPLINWFQRKLSGTVRARRSSDTDGLRAQRLGTRSPSLKDKQRRSSVPIPTLSVPVPTRIESHPESKKHPKGAANSSLPRNTISLNDPDDVGSNTDGFTVSEDGRRSSFARDSLWSPTSQFEADEDASVRPLPPSSPPSPSPSRSSSSYLSDPRTFRSMTASTKPTTLLSIDLTGGMAHIAQAPPTPTTPGHRLPPHIRTHSTGPGSGGSITFSAIAPASPTFPSRPSSGNSINSPYHPSAVHPTLQAPQHTAHHPRNNPRPSSPPQDDASVLTLASSAFGMPGVRNGLSALSRHHSLADSFSHYSQAAGQGDSTSHFLLGEMDDDRLERYHDNYQDVDASVRALRPRSSRRGSWESEASGWSASASLALTGTGTGAPSALGTQRDRSLWTTGSFRTGGVSEYTNAEGSELAEETSEDGRVATSEEPSTSARSVLDDAPAESLASDETEEVQTPPATKSETHSLQLSADTDDPATPSKQLLETPKGTTVPLGEADPMPASTLVVSAGDSHSIATTDIQTDAWRTAASTPIPA